jgi:hypothetical protein
VLPPVPVAEKKAAFDASAPSERARVRDPVPPSGRSKDARDFSGGEDLGAAVPRRVRGVDAKIDRGEAGTSTGGDARAAERAPVYSRATFAAGLGMVSSSPRGGTSGSRGAAAEAPAPEPEEEKDETPSFDFASLASGLAPATGDAAGPAGDGAGGGKKRRRPSAASKPAEPPPPPAAEKKKKKKKKTGDARPDAKSAVDKAMALLLGDS